jgi:hypothetical protein
VRDAIGRLLAMRHCTAALTGRVEDLRRPCMIIDNPQVLRKVVEEHLAPAGHEHSEDLVRDPASRWYREGPDCQAF